jgi:anaphase-promoting complex subunit 10
VGGGKASARGSNSRPHAGNELRAFLVQIRIVENHQNGKDTHLRGVRIYARNESDTNHGLRQLDHAIVGVGEKAPKSSLLMDGLGAGLGEGLTDPAWMGDVELR